MANTIKQTNDGFNSIYKGNFSIGINDVAYGGTAITGFWNTIPATAATGNVTVAYLPKGSNGPAIYEMSTSTPPFITAINQYKTSLEGPYITTSTFTSTTNITIPASTTASTYPMEFNVSGINNTVNWVTLNLGVLSGSNVQNLGIVLVAPDNTTYALIKGSLSSSQSTGGDINVILEPFSGVIQFVYGSWDGYSQGVYNSGDYNGPLGLTFEAPCPVGPFSASTNYDGLNNITNITSGNTNGTWSLYIQDFGGDESTLFSANLSFTTGGLMFADKCLEWAESNDNIALLNRDYPSIITSGLQLHIDPWYLPSANANSISSTLQAGRIVSDLTNNNNDATTSAFIGLAGTNYESWNFYNSPLTFDTVTNIPAGNSAYTTSVWFSTSSQAMGLVTFGTETSYAANYLYLDGSGYIANDWCGTTITSTGSTLNNSNWHNAVVTYDGTIATIYIDGVFDTDLTVGSSLTVSPTSNLEIGGDITSYSINEFSGSMGPVMIYNRALTANEVLTNYNSIDTSHGY